MQGAGGIGGLLASTHFAAQAASPITNHGSPITALHFSYDSNGNVTLLTDALCRPAAKYRYDAFGQTISATGPAAQLNRYRFSTKLVELASSLAYYGYRYYDPRTGRWPSRDPIEEMGGINVYLMTQNNTVGNTDALGLFLTSCSGPPPPVLCCKVNWTVNGVWVAPAVVFGITVSVSTTSTAVYSGNNGGTCCPPYAAGVTITGTLTQNGPTAGPACAVGDVWVVDFYRKADGTVYDTGFP